MLYDGSLVIVALFILNQYIIGLMRGATQCDDALFIDIARIICGTGLVYATVGRPSVCPIRPLHAAAAGLL